MSKKCRLVLLLLVAVSTVSTYPKKPTTRKLFVKNAPSEETFDLCHSPIYCQGELLKTVQLAEIEPDSKTFVDYSQKNDEEVTLANFQKLMKATNNAPSKDQIRNFVKENFSSMNELENATLPDWNPKPELLEWVRDPLYREWVADLNEIWKGLAKRMTTNVRDNPKRHSLIYVNNTFIIPGGRFKEFYYWDSYWVLEGLLLSDMRLTTRGIIENFLSIVNTYGFIPNGGRVYYLMRSQPPLLIPMVDMYYEFTKDWDFVDRHLETLEKEFDFWQRHRSIKVQKNGREYKMARYVVNSEGPRPESYREDYLLAINITDPIEKRAFYNNIKAGAETGWDFSARWFIAKDGEPSLDLRDIATEDIIPVDLNAFLEKNARILARYFLMKNDIAKSQYYTSIAREYRKGIEAILWNELEGTWYDHDIRHQRPRALFYPTNLTPLYTMSYNWRLAPIYGQRTVSYLRANGITEFAGGVPTSLDDSGQQWDLPNAWAPLQSIVVQGLRQTKYQPAMDLAKNLASTWLRSNYLAFNETHKMYEKYDAVIPGEFGGGGEYPVQDGFGWSNGVVLEFLHTYPWAEYRDENNQLMRDPYGINYIDKDYSYYE
ncbi:trehalase-like [Phymastichus coffea]|uniref:trehalase-like n=1 Tax=Phymastichus coffea TaxID=108790 RepID=UPI00273C336E|nr:trehalase-like [Phymastichus coffea]